jgi:hypothetical protein
MPIALATANDLMQKGRNGNYLLMHPHHAHVRLGLAALSD